MIYFMNTTPKTLLVATEKNIIRNETGKRNPQEKSTLCSIVLTLIAILQCPLI